MAFEERSGGAKLVQDLVVGHHVALALGAAASPFNSSGERGA
jgi:hypothetical protein